ncbi:hypothetical protein CC80DRAFT_489625 [Byssothecium circinans]|uniref:Uncharacterized protein n=1 Tax=Byssothecium circinans TaxID=147558 RepID=A0A6A5U499_9PLEO|nr:hypothetical protein CC80DRAFT_489625 [Byssothecium circinans]
MSAKDSPAAAAADDAQATRWDRPRWISVFSSHNPTIREVTECLGLGLSASSSTTNRGIPKFDNPDYRKLSSEVTRLSKELPKERDALLDFAADPGSLDQELEDLLATYGPAIWGRDTDRTCLLTPDPAKKTYSKDLFFEDPDDKEVLKIHLQRWIIIKACYYIRNMKLKRASAASEYETLADMDPDMNSPPSPNATPNSLSPSLEGASTTAGAESSNRPIASKKRKSSVFNSLSDGEDMGSPRVKRPYQHHTMPRSRNSPRKALHSIAGSPISENTPPLPALGSKLALTSTPEVPRTLLTPLSSNHLNGTPRPPLAAAPAGGFTAVNNNSFTAVNTSPPVKEARSHSVAASNGPSYASPYDGKSNGVAPTQSLPNPPKAPPLNTSVSHGFQAINSPVVTNEANGVSARNSPVAHHSSHQLHSSHHQSTPAHNGPASRSNTPVHHHHHHVHRRPSLAHQRSSRSNTPIAPAQPVQPITNVTNQPASAPTVQAMAAAHIHPSSAPRPHHVAVSLAPHPSSAMPYAPPVQAVLKSHPVEAAPAVQHPIGFHELSLNQCEILGLLMQYFFPKPTSPPDEGLLLARIESLWRDYTPHFRNQTGQLFELQAKVLFSWTLERRKVAQLRQEIALRPGLSAAEMVERLLAMNDLRLARLKWKNMSNADGLSAEDLLCRTFAIMTNTEGTEYLFKDGLARLNEGVLEFLRSEDLKILLKQG